MAIVTRFSYRWLSGLLLVALTGCNLPAVSSESEAPPPAQTAPSPKASAAIATPQETVSARIYKLDAMCEVFESQSVSLPKQRTLEAAVGKVLAAQQSSDFDLSGYRVLRRANGEVVIDLRLTSDSRRQMASLSSCEQRALFGSLRETLLRNSQWGVKTIRFVHRGRAIVL